MLYGADVSKWQGEIDWEKLQDVIDFVIIRATYGTGNTDEKFEVNRRGAREKNIPRGFYHYAYPTYNSPESEADWFTKVVGELQKGELLVLDFEENYPYPVDWCEEFLDRLSENFGGYKPLIYLNKFTVQSYDWSPIADANYGLWLALWDYDPQGEFDVDHWDVVAMRQYSNNETFDGIEGRVDANVFYGNFDTFYKYGIENDMGTDLPEDCQDKIDALENEIAEVSQERDNKDRKLEECRDERAENERQYKEHLDELQATLIKSQKLNDNLGIELKNRTEERDKLAEKVEPLEEQINGLKDGIGALEARLAKERQNYMELEKKYVECKSNESDFVKNISIISFIWKKLGGA